jgi:hypothetical protein
VKLLSIVEVLAAWLSGSRDAVSTWCAVRHRN